MSATVAISIDRVTIFPFKAQMPFVKYDNIASRYGVTFTDLTFITRRMWLRSQ